MLSYLVRVMYLFPSGVSLFYYSRFYHNKMSRESVWTIPAELKVVISTLHPYLFSNDIFEYLTISFHLLSVQRARELAEKASSYRPNQDIQTPTGAPVGSTSISREPCSLPASWSSNNMVGIVTPRTHDAVAVMSERFDRVVDLIQLQ